MGAIGGLIKKLIKLTLYLSAFVALIVLLPNLPPYARFSSYEIEPTQEKYQNLDHCVSLNKPKKLFNGKLHGPEAFRFVNGELYTALQTGEIVKIPSSGSSIYMITTIGQPCAGDYQEHICGRPLSIQYDEKQNFLYVLDAYYGIWKVGLKSKKKQLLVSPNIEIDGRRPMLFNSMALDVNGNFYWSDSSSDFKLFDGFYTSLVDPSGRLFFYNAAKNESRVLLDGLAFSNGVAISPNREFVLVCETIASRIIKYYINGPKTGKKEIFVSGLPGAPDNIQLLPDGSGMLVGMYVFTDADHPLLSQKMAPTPIARKFIARMLKLLELPFEYLQTVYPSVVFEKTLHSIGHFKSAATFLPPLTGLLRIDWNGNIVQCYVNSDKSIRSISDAVVFNDQLYLGSPHNAYIASVPVPADLVNTFKTQVVKETKPIEQKVAPVKESKPVGQKPTTAKPVEQKESAPPKPVEQKPTTPKPVQQKPATPKPVEQKPTTHKPIEQKPTTPKPVEQKPTTSKPVEQKPTTPKPVEQKPTTPKPVEQKPTTPKPVEQKPTTPKPVEQKPTTPKPVEQKATPKATESKTNTQLPKPQPTPQPTQVPKAETKPQQNTPKTPTNEPKPTVTNTKEQIPIEEEIPSDTRKPSKESLKVIKRSGPTEIPNPEL